MNAKMEKIQEAWLSARDSQQRADLKEVWQHLQNEIQAVDTRRARLQAQLAGPGVHIPVLGLFCSCVSRKAQAVHLLASSIRFLGCLNLHWPLHLGTCTGVTLHLHSLASTSDLWLSPFGRLPNGSLLGLVVLLGMQPAVFLFIG